MAVGSLDFWTLGSVIWRRKWLIVPAALGAAFLALGVGFILPAKFSSEGGLVVENQRLNIPELGIQANQMAAGNADTVATAIDVLSSRGTIESVVQDLNLAHAPDLQPVMRLPRALASLDRFPQTWWTAVKKWRAQFMPADATEESGHSPVQEDAAALAYLQRHIKVQANERSNLLTIQLEAGSPTIAAAVVNSLMSNYIANDIGARRNQLRQANEWLTQRAGDLRKELDADDQQINAYLKAHEIGQFQGGSVAVVQLSGARDRLAVARETLARLQASVDAAAASPTRGGAAAAPQVLASPVVQALRQREGDLMQRLAALPPVHPERQKLEDETRSVRTQIASETGKILAGLSHDTDVARSNVQQLQQAADRAASDARSASVAQVDYDQLVHDADAKRQIYNAFVARADETRLATMQFPAARIQFQATPDNVPNRASPMMLGFLGLFAGGVIASAAAVSSHLLRHRVSATADITAATGLPVYGSLPEVRLAGRLSHSRIGLPAHRSQSLFEETLRAVWLSMRSMTTQATCTTVVVTSSEVGEGKTTVAAAVARRVAEDGFRVLLVDADLRRRAAGTDADTKSTSDLEAVLTGAVKFEDAVMVEPKSNLHCLMSGGSSANPIRLLASRAFKELLARARREYDFVVLDGPPMMRVADAALLAEECLFTLFVVGYGRVSGSIVAEAISRFPEDGTNKILPVLTRVPARRLDRLDYYGGYGGVREALTHGDPDLDVRLPTRGAPIHSGGALRVVPRRTGGATAGSATQASDIVE